MYHQIMQQIMQIALGSEHVAASSLTNIAAQP